MAGPAGTLQKQVSDSSALDALAMQEQDWLQRLRPQTQALEAAGWTLQHQFWSEIIALKGGQALVQRWLQEDSPTGGCSGLNQRAASSCCAACWNSMGTMAWGYPWSIN